MLGVPVTDIYGVSTSTISATVRTLSALKSSSSSRGASNTALSQDLTSSQESTHRAIVPVDKVAGFLSAAQYIGGNIVGILEALKKAVDLAGSSQVFPYANTLVASGTRVSVGNISADVNRTLERVQELVDNAALGSANILSSTSADLTLKTSAYGGKINITPQPLDLKGLNLENINLHSEAGIKDALARIQSAILIAEKRLFSIYQLDKALNGTNPINSALRNVDATGQSELRGVLVNLYA